MRAMTPKLPRRFRRKQLGILSLTNLCGFGGRRSAVAGATPKILAYEAGVNSTSNLTTYTFSAADIGTAAADRMVHVVVAGRATTARTVSSVTIGGVTATANVFTSSGSLVNVGIYTAAVPTGDTGDVVVTWSGAMTSMRIGVWSSTGLSSATAFDADTSAASPGTATLSTTSGGFCICGVVDSAGDAAAFTWANVTERSDGLLESNISIGFADETTNGADISPSVTYANAPTSYCAVFATF